MIQCQRNFDNDFFNYEGVALVNLNNYVMFRFCIYKVIELSNIVGDVCTKLMEYPMF